MQFVNKDHHDQLKVLYEELYNLNKASLRNSRQKQQEPENHNETAEINKNIKRLQSKILSYGNYAVYERLYVEDTYWTKRVKDLEDIATVVNNIKTALKKIVEDIKYLNENTPNELLGIKHETWAIMSKKAIQVKQDLDHKYREACRRLITYFACRGLDQILNKDKVGLYFMDRYGHQNYITHYFAKNYHVNCEFMKNEENLKYYFDENGRYTVGVDNNLIYQTASCTSRYRLKPDGLFIKIDKCSCDHYLCRHIMTMYSNCVFGHRDLAHEDILPKTEEINIENTLDPETTKYLWDKFGWLLPEILCELANERPKNPVHILAHLLLQKAYKYTVPQQAAMKKESLRYRDNIINKRKEKLEAATKAWKSLQAQRSS